MFLLRSFLICCVCYSVKGESQEREPELLLVHIIFRHGARTTYATYPNDPYANVTYYPFGWGGLTNEGKMGEYMLGQFLRKQYIEFIGEDYYDNKIYVRSTDTLRTKMSALLVVAGLFPPSQSLRWNDELLWQPIPVSYRNENDEDIYHTRVCAFKRRVYDELLNDPNVQTTLIEPNQELFSRVEELSGKSIKHPENLQDFYFILQTQFERNLTLPEWTKEIFPEPTTQVSSLTYAYHNVDLEARKLNMGYFLKKIIDTCEEKIANTLKPKDRKIYLHSGHETSIGYMLNGLLNVTQIPIPEYGSALSFELLKQDDSHFIKLRYRKKTDSTEFEDITIPGCGILCPVEKFKEIYTYLIPTLTIHDACKWDRYNLERSERRY